MEKHHVHVYEVIRSAEMTLSIENEIEARQEAMRRVKAGEVPLKEADCVLLAISWPVDEEAAISEETCDS